MENGVVVNELHNTCFERDFEVMLKGKFALPTLGLVSGMTVIGRLEPELPSILLSDSTEFDWIRMGCQF